METRHFLGNSSLDASGRRSSPSRGNRHYPGHPTRGILMSIDFIYGSTNRTCEVCSTMTNPKVVFLFSGKRKSGKDFVTDKFVESLPDGAGVVVRVSGPLKQEYALQHGLDYEELLSASQYKEQHRLNMITWSEAIRNKQPAHFIDKAVQMYQAHQFPVWVVSDMRRVSDLVQFRKRYGAACVTVRVTATEDTRIARGWTFTAGVDDAESECDLDGVHEWDHELDTSAGDEASVQALLATLQQLCRDRGAYS